MCVRAEWFKLFTSLCVGVCPQRCFMANCEATAVKVVQKKCGSWLDEPVTIHVVLKAVEYNQGTHLWWGADGLLHAAPKRSDRRSRNSSWGSGWTPRDRSPPFNAFNHS